MMKEDIFVYISLVLCHGALGFSTFYLDDHCGGTISVDDQIRLNLTSNYQYQNNFRCTVTIETKLGNQMMVFFRSLNTEDNCNNDWVELDNGRSRSDDTINGERECGTIPPSGVYHTTGQYMTAYFQSDESLQGSGFEMIITSYHTGICYSSEYQCNNYKCISNSLSCTVYNPCGDHSDCRSAFETIQPSTPSPCDTFSDCGVQIKYLDDHCGGSIYVERSHQLRLGLTNRGYYKNNFTCEVTLETSTENQLMMYFQSLNTESSHDCIYDWVELYDGDSRSHSYMAGGKKCGYSTPVGVVQTSGRYMTVYFQSDINEHGTGFEMVITSYHTGICYSGEYMCNNHRCISKSLKCTGYNSCGDHSDCSSAHETIQPPTSLSVQTKYLDDHCGGNIYLEKNHQLRLRLTSSYEYQNNFTCDVTLETSTGNQLAEYFQSLDIESTSDCSYDWVELYDGDSRLSSYSDGGKICGYKTPADAFQTSRRYMTVYFQSDHSVQRTGFDMIITSYHTGTCHFGEFHCSSGKCIARELRCNGLNPCGDHSDCITPSSTPTIDHGVPTEYLDRHCSSTIHIGAYEQIHLKLTSDFNYQPNLRCKVIIYTTPGELMTITFQDLDTENVCSNDWVELDDGTLRSGHNIAGGRQCGNTAPNSIYKTSGPSMTVYFQSDGSIQGTGFDLLIKSSITKYMNIHCGQTINIGDISQLRLKLSRGNYQPNLRCLVSIETNYDDKMMLYFRELSTENDNGCTRDWIEIDDGSSRSDPYLAGGRHCGHIAPSGVYKTSGRYMTLYFQSDSSVQDTGFDMIITSYRTGLCRSWNSEYACSNGRCINNSAICSGYNSCGDYSDCNTRTCKSEEYQCRNGRCIPARLKCNGFNPCGDYSDCTTTSRWTQRVYTATITSYDSDLSAGAITGIVLGCIALTTILIVGIAVFCGRRGTPRPQIRREPLVATINSPAFVRYAYNNPVPVNYADPPPPYPGTADSTAANQGTAGVAAVHKPYTRY